MEILTTKPFFLEEDEIVLKSWIHEGGKGRVVIAEMTDRMPYARLSLFSDNSNTLLPLEFLGKDYNENELMFDYLIKLKYVVPTGRVLDDFNVYRINLDLFEH
jgi:hypothetical protein